ncbi:Glutaredoxin family protein [Euphorbia peplus]|nr:Glutaredoxin family protein [Euphorbia peplus]
MASSLASESGHEGTSSRAVIMSSGQAYDMVKNVVSTNPVVVFSMSGCCMCTVAKRLLSALGVSPTVVELDHISAGPEIQTILFHLAGKQHVPAIFVGGKFLGGIENLMASHINATLVPLLKDVGALWL